MTGRKPRRSEIKAARASRAADVRAWLEDKMRARNERHRLDEKARLLTPSGGGSGVTVEMRRISAEANVDNPPTLNPGGYTGPNRAERRSRRNRADRRWVPTPGKRWGGRYVWPTPSGQNVPYVAPRDTRRSDRA